MRATIVGRRMRRVAAAACLTAAVAACGTGATEAGGATISNDQASTIVEAVTLEAADVGTGFVDRTDSVTDAVDLASCTPSLTVLAQAPWRSFGTGAESIEGADPQTLDVEAALSDVVLVSFATAVYRSTAEADDALEALADTVQAGDITGICQADPDQNAGDAEAEVMPTDFDIDLADEHLAFQLVDRDGGSVDGGDGRPLILFARNGPALTVLGGFAGPDGDLDALVRAVTARIKSGVDAELG